MAKLVILCVALISLFGAPIALYRLFPPPVVVMPEGMTAGAIVAAFGPPDQIEYEGMGLWELQYGDHDAVCMSQGMEFTPFVPVVMWWEDNDNPDNGGQWHGFKNR